MPRQYKHPTNDPISESTHPKVFADGHSEFIELFIFCHKLAENDDFFFFFLQSLIFH